MRKISLYIFFLFIGLLLTTPLHAQLESNKRSKSLILADSVVFDTLSIVPNSAIIQTENGVLDPQYYRIDESEAVIYFDVAKMRRDNIKPTEITLNYRSLLFKFSKEVRDENKYKLFKNRQAFNLDDPYATLVYDLQGTPEVVNDFNFEGLNKSGSFTRGVAFGNAQDASVISSLNLQLSGKLGKDIEILAAITDENVPIQPEGNTQTLQDFDKIFIQLSKGKTKVVAGDFNILSTNTYFLQVNKRAQGLGISSAISNEMLFKKDVKGEMRGGISGGVARGKFRKQTFNGIEGNQGPYKLTGSEGELFIIILSGSEAVFIDGVRMVRGQENDYVIDYNLGQVTFTAKRMITKDSRINIEFEYSDRNYQRWMIYANNEWNYKNFYYKLNFFTEFDNKNAPLSQNLTDAQKLALAAAGNNLDSAIASAIDTVNYNANEVLYKQMDTTINGINYVYYVYSTNPDSAIFRLRFSDVGLGKGNYVLANSLANGRTYKWVAPNADGSKNGQFEPVVKLIAPKKQHMFSLATGYRFNKNFSLDVEGAYGFYDVNTFSKIGNNINSSYAYKAALNYQGIIKKVQNDSLKLFSTLYYEQVDVHFNAFFRYRDVEFERDWNLMNLNNSNLIQNSKILGNDYIANWSTKITQRSWGDFQYQIQGYIKGDFFKGFKNTADLNFNKNKWKITIKASQTSTQDTSQTSLFLRERTGISKTFKKVMIGVISNFEYNAFRETQTNDLQGKSYMFQESEAFLANGDSSSFRWRLFYRLRTDHLPDSSQFKAVSLAHNAGFDFEMLQFKNHQLRTNLTFRQLEILDTIIVKQKRESTLLGRIEYNGNFWKRNIQLNVFYEVGSGMENKRDFQYIESLNNLGTHVWIDYNGNGIKERDEYEIRVGTIVGTDGLTYIKYIVPTNDFIRTNYNQFTANLNIKMPDVWKKSKGIKKILSALSSQTMMRSDQKTQNDNILKSFNPFNFNTLDTALLSMNFSLRQTLYINRFHTKYGLEFSYQDIRNKVLMQNGLDTRMNQFGNAKVRYNITRMFTLNLEGKYGEKISNSQFLRSRDYKIDYWQISPEFIVQPNAKFRVSLSYQYQNKNNRGLMIDSLSVNGGEMAELHNAGLEFRTSFILKGQLSLRSNFILIKYNATQNNALAFEMLEGLNIGNNITWGASFQRTIGQNLQISLTYDGRYSEGSKLVHIASMQVRAFF